MDRTEIEFLTHEALHGELLAEHLARGPLTPEEALRYAIDVGTALHQAHATGVVHGSISTSAILIVDDQAHVICPPDEQHLRTAAYRSPEQVRGETPDTRSDIFSYGAVLYELVSGRPAFSGTGSDLDREILERSPAALKAKNPIHLALESVIAACLAKKPVDRRQRIQNAVIELKLAARTARKTTPEPPSPPPPPPPEEPEPEVIPPPVRRRRSLPQYVDDRPSRKSFRWLLWLFLALVVLAAVAFFALQLLRKPAGAPAYSFKVVPPAGAAYPGMPAVSPDGKLLVFSAVSTDGKRMLWLRALDAERATPLEGTEEGISPFWSPDSRQVAFFAGDTLRRVSLDGGPPVAICATDSRSGGGSWNEDGVILFAPSLSGGIYRVSSAGGQPEPLILPDNAKAERAFLWPQFLPGGRNFVFFAITDAAETTGVYAGALSPASYRFVFPSETNAVFSTSGGRKGYLLYVAERTLMVQPFDAANLTVRGESIPLWQDVGALSSLSLAPVSVSANSVLVYQSLGEPTRQLVWMDHAGRSLSAVREPGKWDAPRIAPDGSRAIAAKATADGKSALWLINPDGTTRLFGDPAGEPRSPVWSPDGTRIAFSMASKTDDHTDLYVRSVNGGAPEPLFLSPLAKHATDWSRDGRYVFFDVVTPGAKIDVWAHSEAHAGPILTTIHTEAQAALSPNGRWLAFQSDENGRVEVYVQAFDGISSGTRRRWSVSAGGGGLPRWKEDGSELYFMTLTGRVMSIAVHPSSDDFQFDAPHFLFQTQALPKLWNYYDVSPDGRRFLVNLPHDLSPTTTFQVVTNWTDKLK